MGESSAVSADQLRVNPYSASGGVRIGNVHSGNKYQEPTTDVGGNQAASSSSLSIPMMGGGKLMNL